MASPIKIRKQVQNKNKAKAPPRAKGKANTGVKAKTPSAVQAIESLLKDYKYETARRYCGLALQAPGVDRPAILQLLHVVQRHLANIPAAIDALGSINPADPGEQLKVMLLLAEDYHLVSNHSFFWESPEAAAGLTADEYHDLKQREASKIFAQAVAQASSDQQRRMAAEVLRRCNRGGEADALSPAAVNEPCSAPDNVTTVAQTASGVVRGKLQFPGGEPVAGAVVTLGLAFDVIVADPATYLDPDIGYRPKISPQKAMKASTNAQGEFRIEDVPAGRHEFLAVTLDPQEYDICTRFLARGIPVAAGKETRLGLTVDEWHPAPPRKIANPLASRIKRGRTVYRKVHDEVLSNPFQYDFPRQPVSFALPAGVGANAGNLLLVSSADADAPQDFQITGTTVTFFTELPAVSDRVVALYEAVEAVAKPPKTLPPLTPKVDAGGHTAVIDTGRAAFRIPWGVGLDPLPPLLALRAASGKWRGKGRLVMPEGIELIERRTEVLDCGPLIVTVRITYRLPNDRVYVLDFTAHRGEAYLMARETCPDVQGMAFEFSLAECIGGRGFLHWTPEYGNMQYGTRHWGDLKAEDRELARIQESVAWWIPPQGFGYAVTPGGQSPQDDYIGVFSLRRGEWIDRKFAAITAGPPGNYELDWPYPEMVGSTISMITAHSSAAGDAYFRFKSFDGQRQWGVLASDLGHNDGPFKEFGLVQHKLSSPRLQDFKDWALNEPDTAVRPSVALDRDKLRDIRRKTTDPAFAKYWNKIVEGKVGYGAATEGVRFAIDADPLVAWRIKTMLTAVAPIYAKMTLLGRDFADIYSPVGARCLGPWAEEFDIVAASGVFSPDEERLVRQFLLTMGYMYMNCDHMNWKFNGRNTNFEADRIKTVGTMGLVFKGHPASGEFLENAIQCTARTLEVYTTPSSGKWYENPACYYFASMVPRMNLLFHLDDKGLYDPTRIPLIKEFLHWGILLMTPRFPHSYEALRDGLTDEQYRSSQRVRRVPPIGDHARLGTWMPEHYALMAKVFRKSDPAFADFMLWAYQEGGSEGGFVSNMPMVLAHLDGEDLKPAPAQTLTSRRLEGFGSVFRGNFGRQDEFYLLFKLGPGGYRFHRTEGSIILFADGKPLIYDGGEAGETWRHTTLSFHSVHMPLAAGHIERFHSLPALDFAQGVSPKALAPGEPVFQSDRCDSELVDVAWARFNEPNPANSRSVIWVKDEYVLVHDELNVDPSIESHWHLQAVADSETFDPQEGYRFVGRYGTDLQVLLPDQKFSDRSVRSDLMLEYNEPRGFALRHLMLTGDRPDHYLGVLRPLQAGKTPLRATELRIGGRMVGVNVRGEGIDDHVFLGRTPLDVSVADVQFRGRYAAVLRRNNRWQHVLIDGQMLATPQLVIESSGLAVCVCPSADGGSLQISLRGDGTAKITHQGRSVTLQSEEGKPLPPYRMPRTQ